MNFELISPVGADVDPMPMTRPDRDKCLNTDTATTRPPSVASSLHNPSRQSQDYEYTDDLLDQQNLLVAGTRALFFLCSGILPFSFLYLSFVLSLLARSSPVFTICSSYQRTTIHFYCHLRNSAHYHNNNTERGGMRPLETTDHESPTVRDGK